VLAYFSCPRGERLGTKTVYILQRWSDKRKNFIDVTDVDQVVDRDHLTITMQSSTELKADIDNSESSSSSMPGFDATHGQVGGTVTSLVPACSYKRVCEFSCSVSQ